MVAAQCLEAAARAFETGVDWPRRPAWLRASGERRRASGSPSAREDLELVRECLGGKGDAYRRLVERHQARVSAMMWRFSRDPDVHGDLVQEVFVSAYESLPRYRGRAPFEHWLARIATHIGYEYWRRQKREQALSTVPVHECAELPDEAVDQLEAGEAAELLHQLLAQLPPRDRLVLTLRYVEGHDVPETARRTGWSQTMVKVQAWRARRKLRALFARAEREVAQ